MMNEIKKTDTMCKVGMVLGFLGGGVATLESTYILAYTSGRYGFGRFGLVGLGVALLALTGAIIIYKGSRPVGAMIMFLSSLIGQLTGGAIGFALVVITSPPPLPIFNETFLVSSWTFISLIGSVLVLSSLRKGRQV
jgi:hypothetical protein